MRLFKPVGLLALLALSSFLEAAIFCVSNSTELENAITVAEFNGQDDQIRLKSGTYIPPNNYGFRIYLGQNFDIHISGSWSGVSCDTQSLNPLDTVLHGDDSKRVISFYTDQSSPTYTSLVSLRVLSINNGLYHEQNNIAKRAAGLGFDFNFSHDGTSLIEQVFFMGNRSNLTSALRVNGRKVIIKNSVFYDNESDIATISSVADDLYFINNTVINNTYYTQFNGGNSDSGLKISGYSEAAFIANNLLWNNYSEDIIASSHPNNPIYYLYNNNYQSDYGVFNYASDNLSEAPQLGFLDFTPLITSPLIDKGLPEPSGTIPFPPPFELNWSYGDKDFMSSDRVVNNRVDIGAMEALPEVPIFKNGFDPVRGG